jgi:hypothetical protein
VARRSELRPCESAGSGCNETSTVLLGGGGVTPFGGGNPRGGTP